MIWTTVIFSFYVVFDVSTTTTNPTPSTTTLAAPTTTPTKDFSVVSLDRSFNSVLEIDQVLNLYTPFSLRLRSCRGTSGILKQTGASGDAFELHFVDQNIILTFTKQSKQQNVTLATNIELGSWNKLRWNATESSEQIEFYIRNNATEQSITLNSTYKDIDLTNGSRLLVGQNLIGCVSSGDQIDLSSFSTGTCFLDSKACPKDGDRLKCEDIQCYNGETCHEADPPYCACASGYSGELCKQVIGGGGEGEELCPTSPCLNGGTCVRDADGNSSCVCLQETIDHTNFTDDNTTYDVGYSGQYCETWIDACSMEPSICIEGACKKDAGRPLGFKCFCPQGADFRVGEYCQYKTDICKVGSKCINGGTCTALGGEKFRCSCMPGYQGKNCEVDIDECASNPCLNEGVCQDGVNHYNCSCHVGTLGDRCEINIDECLSQPCLNSGVCIDGINRFSCNCNGTGYEGELCATEVDECASSPCQNGATCQNLVNDYNCSCYTGYEGKDCEIDTDECSSDPCQNGASCYQNNILNNNYTNNAGYQCVCLIGFTGANCEEDIDDCASNPCQFGNCTDDVNSFYCICNPGYTGWACADTIHLCELDNPCFNGGTCVNTFFNYSCRCPEDFGGKNCGVKLIGCQHVSCDNNSHCVPRLVDEETNTHGYRCDCDSGFIGPDCAVDSSLSFDEDSSLLIHFGTLTSIGFNFKTKLSSKVYISSVVTSDSLQTVVLSSEKCLRVIYRTFADGKIAGELQRELCSSLPLNSGEWIRIEMKLENDYSSSFLYTSLISPGCHDDSCLVRFNVSRTIAAGGHLSFGRLSKDANVTTTYNSTTFVTERASDSLVRCLSEIKLDDAYVMLNDSDENLIFSGVTAGCRGICNDSACQNNGVCKDSVDDIECKCERNYYGKTCSEVMKPATFGHNFKDSFMIFNVSQIFKASDLKDKLEVSLTFRTIAKDGLIFLIKSYDENYDADNAGILLLSCVLIRGSLAVIEVTGMQDPLMTEFDFIQFLDGKQHLMKLSWDYRYLSLQIDEDTSFTIFFNSSNENLTHLTQVSIGGMSDNRLTKRQLSNGSYQNFLGTLQGFRLNDIPFDLTCGGNASDAGGSIVSTDECQNVVPGEVTSDVCTFTSPCPEGFECKNVFFNGYDCECSNKLEGGNCNEGVCSTYTCPEGYQCRSVKDDGFECLATGSFKSLNYLINLEEEGLQSTFMRLKTKNRVIRLLRLSSFNVDIPCVISIELNNNLILIKSNNHIVETMAVNHSLGRWIEFNVTFSSAGITFNSNPIRKPTKSYTNACYMDMNFTHVSVAGENFDGCASEIRVNGILLPFFFDRPHLSSATSFYHKFLDVQEEDFALGACSLGDVCRSNPCMNGGICTSSYLMDYSCRCLPGFDGKDCQICLLDECPQNCSSNSGCETACGSNCDTPNVLSQGQVIAIIVGTVMGALLLVLMSTIIYGIVKVKSKRANQGVYNPSVEEAAGTSVHFNEALKIPTEERLI